MKYKFALAIASIVVAALPMAASAQFRQGAGDRGRSNQDHRTNQNTNRSHDTNRNQNQNQNQNWNRSQNGNRNQNNDWNRNRGNDWNHGNNQNHDNDWNRNHDNNWNRNHDNDWNRNHDNNWNRNHYNDWNRNHDNNWNRGHNPPRIIVQNHYYHAPAPYYGSRYAYDYNDDWQNIAVAAGFLNIIGDLTHDDTLCFVGDVGALYAISQFDQDRYCDDPYLRARAQFFNRPFFWRDGVRYERVIVVRNGGHYYQFRRCR